MQTTKKDAAVTTKKFQFNYPIVTIYGRPVTIKHSGPSNEREIREILELVSVFFQKPQHDEIQDDESQQQNKKTTMLDILNAYFEIVDSGTRNRFIVGFTDITEEEIEEIPHYAIVEIAGHILKENQDVFTKSLTTALKKVFGVEEEATKPAAKQIGRK